MNKDYLKNMEAAWQGTTAKESTGFTEVPEGDYQCKVESAQIKDGKQGQPILHWGLRILSGEYAKRMKALGAYVIGVRRADTNKPDFVDELYLTEKLDELIPRADIIALALPNTPSTVKILNAERLANIKDGAFIINVGRGNAIDTEAICDCALSGKLGGAALDVTDPEPLPSDHRMWGIENILITPHVSGFFHMRETYENMVGIMIENMRRFVSGDMELVNIIDKTTGYRKL